MAQVDGAKIIEEQAIGKHLYNNTLAEHFVQESFISIYILL